MAKPILTLQETSTYLGVPKSTIHAWARGKRSESLITCFPPHGHQATVPFVGFAEAFVLSSFRKAKVPMQRIRPAVEVLNREIGLEHALASQRLYTDGAEVLYDFAANGEGEGLMDLVVLRTGQRQFSEIVESYLKRIEYGNDGWASSVRLPVYRDTDVVVDPNVAFGVPFVASRGVRVEDLVDRFQAGDSVDEIADDFDVSRSEVEDVLRVATLGSE